MAANGFTYLNGGDICRTNSHPLNGADICRSNKYQSNNDISRNGYKTTRQGFPFDNGTFHTFDKTKSHHMNGSCSESFQ